MVRTDGSSPAQMFFNRTQKHGLPLLNPNAKPFEPDNLIKKRDKLHEQRIKLRDQHSVIIEDLAPGQEVLTQDYLSGLWNDSAVVLSKREDGRSYLVGDNQGRSIIVSSDTLLSSSGSNGIASRPALSQRPLRPPDHVQSPGIRTVGSGEEHTRSELPGRIKGSHNPHREFRISLHQNPSRDSKGNVDPNHRFWTSPLLSEVSSVSIPQAATAQAPQGTLLQGISEPGQELGDERHGRPGRNIPTTPRSGVSSDCNSRTTWCDLISERSAPEPPTQYRKIDVARWVSEAVQHSPELPDTISWKSDKSDIVYLGEFNSPSDFRQRQPAPISQKLEPVQSHSSMATTRAKNY